MHISRKLNYYWASAWLLLTAAVILSAFPNAAQIIAAITAIGERIFEFLERNAPDFAQSLLYGELFGNLFLLIVFLPIFVAAIISALIQARYSAVRRLDFLIGIGVVWTWAIFAGFWFFVSSYLVEYFFP